LESIPLHPGTPPGQETVPGGEVPLLTLYPAANPRRHGAVVVCPGGGYAGRAPHEAGVVAEWLNSVGVSAAVVDYRVAPFRHPCPLLDAQRAIRWVRHQAPAWNLDPSRIGILGFSAGGHLAATSATHYDAGDPTASDPVARESCRPDAAVLCYPVITFRQHLHQGSMENLLGPAPDAARRAALSAEANVSADSPPMFLWHTADDGGVSVQNSLLLAAALGQQGVPFELHVFPRGAHGLGLAPDDPVVGQWTGLCARWLQGLGFAG
jgi:acetyl esterase/lipase